MTKTNNPRAEGAGIDPVHILATAYSHVLPTTSDRVRRYLRTHTGAPIAIAVGIGVAFLVVAFVIYAVRCWGDPSGECEAIRKSPPWLLMTALASAPPALLTWYWRTMHKKDDIDHANAAELNARFANGVELLSKGQAGGIYVLEGVARDSPEKFHWPVVETLASSVRGWYGDDAQGVPPPAVMKQALIKALGRRKEQHDPKELVIDLPRTQLTRLDFRKLNFERANFEGAHMGGSNLREANFRGADLSNIQANDAVFDDSTDLGLADAAELLAAHLVEGKARDERRATVKAKQEDVARLRARLSRAKTRTDEESSGGEGGESDGS